MTQPTPLYLCLLFGAEKAVLLVQEVTADNDATAIDAAMALCLKRSDSHGYELWQAARKVAAYHGSGRISRAAGSASPPSAARPRA